MILGAGFGPWKAELSRKHHGPAWWMLGDQGSFPKDPTQQAEQRRSPFFGGDRGEKEP